MTLGVLALVYAFFRFTPLGLAMRAAAQNHIEPTGRHQGRLDAGDRLGPGGGDRRGGGNDAGADRLSRPQHDARTSLLYAFAGAILGGIDNPWGAALGGFTVGVPKNIAGAYLVGPEIKLSVALVIIIGVLVMRPSGLFGREIVTRV